MKDISVFISYYWENKKIMNFVEWLTAFLAKYDINVELDQFSVLSGSNL